MSTSHTIVDGPIVFCLSNRRLTIAGTQGDCEYATDDKSRLWYRFVWSAPQFPASWKRVAK